MVARQHLYCRIEEFITWILCITADKPVSVLERGDGRNEYKENSIIRRKTYKSELVSEDYSRANIDNDKDGCT